MKIVAILQLGSIKDFIDMFFIVRKFKPTLMPEAGTTKDENIDLAIKE